MAADSSSRAAVLWDLDGTLVDLEITLDDVRAWKRELDSVFEPLGWSEGWSPLLESLERALDTVGDALDRAQVYALLDERELEALKGIRVHDAVLAVAAELSALGVRQAIVTNNGPSALLEAERAMAARAGELGVAPPRFDVGLCRGPARRAKPAPDILRDALSALGGGFDAVVMVGDSSADEGAAHALAAEDDVAVSFVRATAGALSASIPGLLGPLLERGR
jgi:FMN phosphatase YigB (HAD superfamily)